MARVANPLAAVLAVLSLVLPIFVPAGYMVAPTDRGASIVVCTGHGRLLFHPDHGGKPGKPSSSHQSSVCAFAGHGAAAAPPTVFAVARAHFEPLSAQPIFGVDLLPGRGLAAPPPPSQGPPQLLI